MKKKYYNDQHAIWIDLRYTRHNTLHASGMQLTSIDTGIQLKIEMPANKPEQKHAYVFGCGCTDEKTTIFSSNDDDQRGF